MKKVRVLLAACSLVLAVAVFAVAGKDKEEANNITGTWECMGHGGPQGDTPFTLSLEQQGEKVTGSVSSPLGGTEITSATFKDDVLDIHLDTEQGLYVITGKLKDGRFRGETTHDGEKQGTWEGERSTTSEKKPPGGQ